MAVSGFLLAVEHFHFFSMRQLIGAIVGIGLVIASACVFNNWIDRGLDRKMSRTRHRVLATGAVSTWSALLYASLLGGLGFTALIVLTNRRTAILCAAAIFSYVVLYGWAKRRTVHGTLIGTVPGAIPPAAGYVAVSNRYDGGALLLFLTLVFWQMAHFYAIAIYRYKDYAAAGLPVMPVRHGFMVTRTQILIYIAALTLALSAMTVFGYEGFTFLGLSVLVCTYWLREAVRKPQPAKAEWGKRMFRASLIVLISLSALIPLGSVLA